MDLHTRVYRECHIYAVYDGVLRRLSLARVRQLTMKRMQFAAVFLTFKGVRQVAAAEHRGATLSNLFSNAIFRDIVLSLVATIGLYVAASIIHVRGLGSNIIPRR